MPLTTTRTCLPDFYFYRSSSPNNWFVSSPRRRLQVTEKAVEEYRLQINDRKPENYGFASMAAVPYAHIVANMLKGKKPKGTDVILAPNPRDIVSRSRLLYHSTTR
jgi:hypothetical protein